MGKRIYSDKERAVALAFLESTNGDVSKAAKLANVPRITLWNWSKGLVARVDDSMIGQEKAEAKRELSEIIDERVREYLEAATGAVVEEATLPQLWTGIGIGIDKKQLLTGQPTSITKRIEEMNDAELDEYIHGLEDGFNVGAGTQAREGASADREEQTADL
jgi:hypothetical protein